MALYVDIPEALRGQVIIGPVFPAPADLGAAAREGLAAGLPRGTRLELEGDFTATSAWGVPLRGTSAVVRDLAMTAVERRVVVFCQLLGGVAAVVARGVDGPALDALLASIRQDWDDDVASLHGLLAGFDGAETASLALPSEHFSD